MLVGLGYWLWKNCKRNNNAAPLVVPEKPAHSQPEIKTFNPLF
jgi:hypothetical protein